MFGSGFGYLLNMISDQYYSQANSNHNPEVDNPYGWIEGVTVGGIVRLLFGLVTSVLTRLEVTCSLGTDSENRPLLNSARDICNSDSLPFNETSLR